MRLRSLFFTPVAAICFYCSLSAQPAPDPLPHHFFYSIRSGLPHVKRRIDTKLDVTVAFLGGSITFNPGWRDSVCAWLRQEYPKTKFRFIAAGIPSLGSLPHAFRLQEDLLDSGRIDLLFLEAAVNDHVNGTDSLTQLRALEGIIRHTRKSNADADIIMMAFADPDKTASYDAGVQPLEVANQELIAAHYYLPSINLAKEVHDRIRHREFDWDKDFKDLHPSPFGQTLYFSTIRSLLADCLGLKKNISRKVPGMLNRGLIDAGRYVKPSEAITDSLWHYTERWKPTDTLATRPGFVDVPMLEGQEPGAGLTLSFTGTAVGISVVSGADAGMIRYAIDSGETEELDLFTQWSASLHLPWYLLLTSGLKNEKHELRLMISDKHNSGSRGYACRIVHFLVN